MNDGAGQGVPTLEICDLVIAARPDFADGYFARGNALFGLGRLDEAITSYDRAIALQPGHAAAHFNRAIALQTADRPAEALAGFDAALALAPESADAHANRGLALQDLGRLDEALASFDFAIALNPDFAGAHSNRGVLLQDMDRPEDALAALDAAIALRPDFAEAYANRGHALQDMLRPEEALESYDRAIAARPDFARAYWTKGLALLQLGRMAEGWALFERRAAEYASGAARNFAAPLWLGDQDVAGKTLFVHWEQGFGDTLQFCRYARAAATRGAKVILSVQDPLVRLIRQWEPDITVIGGTDPPAAFDYHCPMMSLPLALGASVEAIPSESPYLRADPADAATWRARMPPSGRPRIGLAWSGARIQKNDRNRSMDLRSLLPLLTIDADWVCLQKDVRDTDVAILATNGRLQVLTDDLRDFADTAALIETLDLVVSVDTSVAHLAGALGKPVWVMLPYNPDWRWLLKRADSPWYPTARLFRQKSSRDWAGVVDAIGAEIVLEFATRGDELAGAPTSQGSEKG